MSEKRLKPENKTDNDFLSRDEFKRMVLASRVDEFDFFYTDSAVKNVRNAKTHGTVHVEHFTKIAKRSVNLLKLDDLIKAVEENKILVKLKAKKPARSPRGLL